LLLPSATPAAVVLAGVVRTVHAVAFVEVMTAVLLDVETATSSPSACDHARPTHA
jgi:hypothetical protein